MSIELLLKDFHRISEAPDAIDRLRLFFVSLGVTGRLSKSPQTHLWKSCCIGDCATVWNGRAYKQAELLASGTPVIRIQNLNGSKAWYFSNLTLEPKKYCDKGDLLYAWSGTFGPYIWHGERGIFHYHIWRLALKEGVDKRFFYYVLKDLTAAIKAEAHGLMLPHMTKSRMESWPLLLPQIEEQRAIAVRLDQLMNLCSDLENRQSVREARRDKLVTASLVRLTTSADEISLRESARFYFNHLPCLTTRPEHVERLRQTILDLAVHGKLIEQNAADEPASQFLARIDYSQCVLFSKAKQDKKATMKTSAVAPFEIPKGWAVAALGAISSKLGAGSTPLGGKTVYQTEGIPFIRSQNVYDDGLKLDDVALISSVIHARMSGTHVRPKDLLLNITGASIGRCAVVPDDFEQGNVSQHVAIIRLLEPALRDFIHLSLISPFYQARIMDVQVGVSREGLSMQRLKDFPMVIPPLQEQTRILQKVNELLQLCGELDKALTEGTAQRSRFLEAALHTAVDRLGSEIAVGA